jgi:hypothetical protein
MGVTAVASNVGGWAVDAYRARLQAQVERRRLATLQFNLLVSASLGAVGLVTDTVAMHLRLSAAQRALDEAVSAGDLERAELLRGQVTSMLQDPPASARLLNTLADYIPAIVAEYNGNQAPVIEGGVAP